MKTYRILRVLVLLYTMGLILVQSGYISDLRQDRQFWEQAAIAVSDTAVRLVYSQREMLCGN